jgi:hypothetical protein
MANGYYSHTTYPGTNSQGASAPMRAELDAVMSGFALLPDPLGSGQKGFVGGQWNTPIIVGGLIDNAVIGSITLLASGDITRDGSPTTNRAIHFMSNGVKRASLFVSSTETGSNSGSDVVLQTFTDAGALLNTVLRFDRPTGKATFSGGIVAASLDAAPIGNTTRATGKFTSIDASLTLNVGGVASFGAQLGVTSAFPTVEFADNTQTLPNGRFRFYSSANIFGLMKNTAAAGDYSTNIALMYFNAAGVGNFNVRPAFNGATPWDNANLPNPIQTTGGTFTGAVLFNNTATFDGVVTLDSADAVFSQPLIFRSGAYTPRMRSNLSNSSMEWVNGANNALNMALFDNGQLSLPRARPTWAGLTPWDTGNLPDPARLSGAAFVGTITAPNVTITSGGLLTFQTPGYQAYARADVSGQVGFINQAGNAFNLLIQDGGTVNFPRARPTWAGLTPWDNGNFDPNSKVPIRNNNGNRGYALSDTPNNLTFNWEGRVRMWVDGFNQGLIWSDTNFDPGSKANNGATCQWTTGIAEWGPITGVSTLDIPAPWVMVGWRTTSGGNWTSGNNYLRGVILRNQ